MLPASVKFDFDLCRFKADLIGSIESFEVGDELGNVVDRYIAPRINGTILGDNLALVDKFNSFILGAARTRTNQIKTSIRDMIVLSSPCSSSRRLDVMDIDPEGSQRLLKLDQTFDSLVDQILDVEGVQSATAGFDLSRMEIGIDVAIRVEDLFDRSSFQSLLNTVFDKLSPIQTVFGADENAAVDNLLKELEVKAAFWLSMSVGAKVSGSVTDFFENPSSDFTSTGYLRIDEFGASVYAQVDNLNLELFPEINISDGAMEVNIGVELKEPYEFIVDSTHAIGFNEIVTGYLRFEPHGSLAASFPFSATVGNISQDINVLFDDNDLFDEEEVLVTVNYNACKFRDAFQQILGKLGAINLSPEDVLGPTAFSGIAIESLDSIFPDVGGFMAGVLEGESLKFLDLFSLGINVIDDCFSYPILQPRMSSFIYARR